MSQIAPQNRKKMALALPGCSGRAVVYIGLLEALEENGIPVDMIAATSSASIIACAYGSGTLPQLKHKLSKLKRKDLFDLFELSFKGGIFSLDKIEQELGPFITAENLEDMKIPIALTASDLVSGEGVSISMGNTMRAVRASCAYPGFFEPVMWGDRVLIDGGLFEILPIETARTMNPDVIIGVDMIGALNLFDNVLIGLRRSHNILKIPFVATEHLAQKIWHYITKGNENENIKIDNIKAPSMLKIIGAALDYAIAERKKEENIQCDLMITPAIKENRIYVENAFDFMYQEGRKAAIAALPQIRKLMQLEKQHEPVRN